MPEESLSRLLPYTMQVLIEASVSGEHLHNLGRQGKPAAVQPNLLVWQDGLYDTKPGRTFLSPPPTRRNKQPTQTNYRASDAPLIPVQKMATGLS